MMGNRAPTMTTDAALLAAARADPEAFRELYGRYADRIHRYFLRRTREAESAYDLTAETFAQAWVVRARFVDLADGSAAPWLYGIARNVLLMSVRRGELERGAAQRLGVLERLGRDGAAAAATAAAPPGTAWADGADELLDTLPPSQREAVRLRVLEDLDYAEVAAQLGTSPSAARVRVHRGLSALRARLRTPEETS
jgi:RNA polymerase sigma-70 factor (ECF subfamily)